MPNFSELLAAQTAKRVERKLPKKDHFLARGLMAELATALLVRKSERAKLTRTEHEHTMAVAREQGISAEIYKVGTTTIVTDFAPFVRVTGRDGQPTRHPRVGIDPEHERHDVLLTTDDVETPSAE